MRLLHTSDWHLGTTLGRVRRTPDHVEVIDEIEAIARDLRPNLIVHTGDLFDHARPAVDDLEFGVDALRRLAGFAPVVVLAGNHDSPRLFDVFERLLALGAARDAAGVRFVARARPPASGGILTFAGDDGEEIRLAPVPFVHPNALLEVFDVPPERRTASYTDQVQLVEASLTAGLLDDYDVNRHVLLFAAHLHVGGARWSGSERPLHLTDTYATSVEHLPPVSYAAFGHIHRPQELPGAAALGRYAGSPIQIDFGEIGEEKSVVVVDGAPGRHATVECVPLSGGRQLRRVEGTLDQIVQINDVGRAILAATVDTETPTIDLAHQVANLFPQATIFDVAERCKATAVPVALDVTEAVEPPLRDLFRDYVAAMGTPDAQVSKVLDVFEQLLAAVDAEEHIVFDEEALFAFPGTDAP